MPFPLLQALLLLLLLPLLAVSQNSVSLLLCLFCFRGAIMSWTKSYVSLYIVWLVILTTNFRDILHFGVGISEDLSFFFFSFLLSAFFISSLSSVFLLFILDFKFILIFPPMLGCTVVSSVNVCLFPQSARSAGLRVIPTAWHFRLWVCLPLLIHHPILQFFQFFMSWRTLMWTKTNQLTKGLGKHSSISCNVVLFHLWVCY